MLMKMLSYPGSWVERDSHELLIVIFMIVNESWLCSISTMQHRCLAKSWAIKVFKIIITDHCFFTWARWVPSGGWDLSMQEILSIPRNPPENRCDSPTLFWFTHLKIFKCRAMQSSISSWNNSNLLCSCDEGTTGQSNAKWKLKLSVNTSLARKDQNVDMATLTHVYE